MGPRLDLKCEASVARMEPWGHASACPRIAPGNPGAALWLPNHQHMQPAGPVRAEDQDLRDVGRAGGAGYHVDIARQRVGAEFFAQALPYGLVIARDVLGVDHDDVRV